MCALNASGVEPTGSRPWLCSRSFTSGKCTIFAALLPADCRRNPAALRAHGRIAHHVDDRRLTGSQCFLQRGTDLRRFLDAYAKTAHCFRYFREIDRPLVDDVLEHAAGIVRVD